MSDLISRQAAIDALEKIPVREFKKTDDGLLDALISIGQVYRALKQLPPVQPVDKDINVSCKDAISRQAAIDIFDDYNISVENGELEAYSRDRKRLCNLPSAQPEDCDTCKHGYFGDDQCERCRVRYPSHYERRTDGEIIPE